MKTAQTVLIITDAEEIYSGIGWLLQKRGYMVIEVVNSEGVVAHATRVAPSLILIDTDQPLNESQGLARSFREHPRLAGTKICIVTNEGEISSQGRKGDSEGFVNRNDSASIMNLVSNLDSFIERPLSRAHRA